MGALILSYIRSAAIDSFYKFDRQLRKHYRFEDKPEKHINFYGDRKTYLFSWNVIYRYTKLIRGDLIIKQFAEHQLVFDEFGIS